MSALSFMYICLGIALVLIGAAAYKAAQCWETWLDLEAKEADVVWPEEHE